MWEAVLKLLLAAVLGGAIGLEREAHGRPAGLRTNILVCVGATLIMVVARAAGSGVVDPGRAMAGIVTGIGFLGAGAIIKLRNLVRGLTTAACIWLVAALGIAIGQGLYGLAAVTAALALFVLIVVDRLSRGVPAVSYHLVTVEGRSGDPAEIVARCRGKLEAAGLRVLAVEAGMEGEEVKAVLHVRRRGRVDVAALVRELLSIPGVSRATWED